VTPVYEGDPDLSGEAERVKAIVKRR